METKEQTAIYNLVKAHIASKEPLLIKVEAVAGSGKTTTLVGVSDLFPTDAHLLYLAYNKSIATEANEKFPRNTECKTTHSLAYEPIIKYGLDLDGNTGTKRSIGVFNHRSITEKLDYDEKIKLIADIEKFFLSDAVDIEEYFEDEDNGDIAESYVNQMVEGKIPVTHSFYLKMFHILLHKGHINYDDYDGIMLDEAGDINAVTLAIFRLLPSKIKLMVGDSQQNIYSFNHTINGFQKLEGEGVTMHLSQSFRCNEYIAAEVQTFSNRHLDELMHFKGTDHGKSAIETRAIVSRTNSGLIDSMIALTRSRTKFTTIRNPNEIFALILVLMNLYKQQPIRDPRFKFLEDDVREFYSSEVTQKQFSNNILKFIEYMHEEDRDISVALQTLFRYKAKPVYEAYKFAKECYNSSSKAPLYLTTAHSSKGLTFDEVTIANDFDISKILAIPFDERTNQEQEELRLVYVAMTRARTKLNNHKQFFDTPRSSFIEYDLYAVQEID